jgi:hypothetical protein
MFFYLLRVAWFLAQPSWLIAIASGVRVILARRKVGYRLLDRGRALRCAS